MSLRILISRLAPALGYLVLAAAVLLVSDLDRRGVSTGTSTRVAIMQYSSRPALGDAVAGAVEGLAERGWVEGRNLEIRRFNAENDVATAHAIAKQICAGSFRMVITVSTVCLQTMASANRAGRVIHVFGAVTDPMGAGVGIDRNDPGRHPPHLAGIGSFHRVEEVFRLVKAAFPDLKTVGTIWCPAEACSAACVEKARAISKALGITLVEKMVDSSVAVREATLSLLSRGVDAIWIGGDNTVELAAAQVIGPARRAGVPVFTNNPDEAPLGAVVCLGANYRELGRLTGLLAAKILGGLDPATVRIENVVPPLLCVNRSIEQSLKAPWNLAPLASRADILIGPDGTRVRGPGNEPRGRLRGAER